MQQRAMPPVVSATVEAGAFPAMAVQQNALTCHARERCARRGISPQAVQAAWEHGRLIENAGCSFLFLGRREIEEACACGADWRALDKCHGLVVLVSETNQVITVYRNSRVLVDIRRKRRYDQRRSM